MDQKVRGMASRYYDPQIKRKELFEPEEVEIGHEFISRLITLRIMLQENRPVDYEERQRRFKRDKNIIAQQMRYDFYVSMPAGAKGFEARCASVKKLNPSMEYSEIARQEKKLNQRACDDLYASVRDMLERHVNEPERRRMLMLRMCRYNKL